MGARCALETVLSLPRPVASKHKGRARFAVSAGAPAKAKPVCFLLLTQ
jgi:hypothetical protein